MVCIAIGIALAGWFIRLGIEYAGDKIGKSLEKIADIEDID